nr:glycosyltransferase AER61 [Tanacetum cinerariifolium]
MVKMMEELGFRVIIVSSADEMSNIEKFSHVINSSSVVAGAYEAGLANEMFLPDGAVMVDTSMMTSHNLKPVFDVRGVGSLSLHRRRFTDLYIRVQASRLASRKDLPSYEDPSTDLVSSSHSLFLF